MSIAIRSRTANGSSGCGMDEAMTARPASVIHDTQNSKGVWPQNQRARVCKLIIRSRSNHTLLCLALRNRCRTCCCRRHTLNGSNAYNLSFLTNYFFLFLLNFCFLWKRNARFTIFHLSVKFNLNCIASNLPNHNCASYFIQFSPHTWKLPSYGELFVIYHFFYFVIVRVCSQWIDRYAAGTSDTCAAAPTDSCQDDACRCESRNTYNASFKRNHWRR